MTSSCSNKETEESGSNPLLGKWSGPFGGVPAFDKMDIGHVQEAMEKGMAIHLEEIEAIANNSEAPTFDNTILAMEKSGSTLTKYTPTTTFL